MATLSVALKEWHLVIQALLSGRQAILLRKGGILEANNEFELEHAQFLLYPTYVHQTPAQLKPEFRAQVQQTSAEPTLVTLNGFASVQRIYEAPSRAAVDALYDLHIWDTPLIDLRFAYRPEKPLYVVLVRAWRLPQPVTIPNTLEYAGCKSWIPLAESIDISSATPALADEPFHALATRLEPALAKAAPASGR